MNLEVPKDHYLQISHHRPSQSLEAEQSLVVHPRNLPTPYTLSHPPDSTLLQL